jgi:hypothetical protein
MTPSLRTSTPVPEMTSRSATLRPPWLPSLTTFIFTPRTPKMRTVARSIGRSAIPSGADAAPEPDGDDEDDDDDDTGAGVVACCARTRVAKGGSVARTTASATPALPRREDMTRL